MDRRKSVRQQGYTSCAGDDAAFVIAESPSFYRYLSDHQRFCLAFFEVAHGSCGDLTLVPFWLDDLGIIEELECSCESCCITRTFDREGR